MEQVRRTPTVPSWANPLFRLFVWYVLLWPLQAAAQLDSSSFGPIIPRGSSANYTFAVAAGDLNGDGFADLVVTDMCGVAGGQCNDINDRNSGVQVLINNGDGSFHLGNRYATNDAAGNRQSVAIVDVDGDHKADVVVMNSVSISVMRGNGDSTLQPAVSYPLNTDTYYPPIFVNADKLTVADVNGDGKPDIIVSVSINHTDRFFAEQFRAGVSVLLNNGDGTFARPVLYDSGGYAGAPAVITADVNRDGFPDLVVLNLCSTPATSPNGTYCSDANTGQLLPGTVGVLLGNGNGTFQPAIVYPSGGYEPVGLAVADLDRDGNPDLLVANQCSTTYSYCNEYGISNVSVLMGNPDGSFAAPVNYSDGAQQPVSVAAGDIDGDGAPDVAVLNYCSVAASCDGLTPIVAGLPGNGDGTLQTPVSPSAPLYGVGGIYAHTVLLVDVNNDGKPDLVVGFWTGVGVRLNQTPRAATTTSLDSQPNPSGDADAATFTATVSSSAPGVPTGTVTFREGATVLGTAPLVNGAAALDVSGFSIGSHVVVASYSSDSAFRASDSDPLTQVVKASTSTSVGSSANPSIYQQSVTFTATVTAQHGGTPTGNVTFNDGATVLGSSALSGNTATLSTSTLSLGMHSITAVYGSDANHAGSTSLALNQSIVIPAPTITNFSPSSGPVGTSVTITGTNFTGATAVKFNGTAATTYTVNSAIQITATVPAGATTGSIAVTTAGGTATSATSFTVIAAPTITGFSPTSGPVGTVVTITGTNFTGATAVKFNGTAATTYTVNSATQITATVPASATTGSIALTTAGGTATSLSVFTVTTGPVPTITSFKPTSGTVGTSVTINGTNLSGTTKVTFNGVSASFRVKSSSQITAVVPANATTGPIAVTTPGGTATSATFTVKIPPAISGFSPTSGPVGTVVTITGTAFTGATAVQFGKKSASFTVNAQGTTILATVPGGARTARIAVKTPGGTASSASNFTVTP